MPWIKHWLYFFILESKFKIKTLWTAPLWTYGAVWTTASCKVNRKSCKLLAEQLLSRWMWMLMISPAGIIDLLVYNVPPIPPNYSLVQIYKLSTPTCIVNKNDFPFKVCIHTLQHLTISSPLIKSNASIRAIKTAKMCIRIDSEKFVTLQHLKSYKQSYLMSLIYNPSRCSVLANLISLRLPRTLVSGCSLV